MSRLDTPIFFMGSRKQKSRQASWWKAVIVHEIFKSDYEEWPKLKIVHFIITQLYSQINLIVSNMDLDLMNGIGIDYDVHCTMIFLDCCTIFIIIYKQADVKHWQQQIN